MPPSVCKTFRALVRVTGWVVALLALSGCGAPAGDQSESLPTVYDIPTLTPDFSPPELPPSWTPSAEASLTPTNTPTVTTTPTITVTPSVSVTPRPTPTLTFTPGPPPTATLPPGASLSSIRLQLETAAAGLNQPTSMADPGDGRLYVTEKKGRIRLVQGGGVVLDPFLNLGGKLSKADSEDGLLGLAFHPGYSANGIFYVYYNNNRQQSVLSRFTATSDHSRANASSETVLLTIDQPTPEHNGGGLKFGPDGYLYLSLGDGGGIHGEYYNAQSGATLHGTIIRIDVTSRTPYVVPSSNPFVGDPAFRDEIWVYGLRNPWSFSFDRATGDVYIADVGETEFEEVNVQSAGVSGLNYGWPDMEGRHCYRGPRCEQPGLTNPVYDYKHDVGCAVVGGYVYRGREYPALGGTYLFGDFCTGDIWGMQRVGGQWQVRLLANTGYRISAFGEDRGGELYVFGYDNGLMQKITAR